MHQGLLEEKALPDTLIGRVAVGEAVFNGNCGLGFFESRCLAIATLHLKITPAFA